MRLYYGAWMLLARFCFSFFAKWEVEGKENIPPMGPLIVVSNHLSNADPPLIMASFSRPLRGLAKKGLFSNPFLGLFFKSIGAHPLDREGVDMAALRWMLRMLEQDEVALMFPEGTRSRDAALKRSMPGVGYVALRSQAPILPVAITGTERINNYLRIAFPFRRLTVKIGQPFTLPLVEGKLTRPLLQQYADIIMQRIASLLPPEYRGYYAVTATQEQRIQGAT